MMKQIVHSALTILVSFILQFCDHGTASAFAIIQNGVEFSNRGSSSNSNSDSNDAIHTNTNTNARRQNILHMTPQDIPRGGGRGGEGGGSLSSSTKECDNSINNGFTTSCSSSTSKTRTSMDLRATTTDYTEASPPPPEQISSENWSLLSERGKKALSTLIQLDDGDGSGAQEHVYGNWPEVGSDDDGKVQLTEQLADLDTSYPGGLAAYITKAKSLLKESAEGSNPFADYSASIPSGEYLSYDDNNKDDDTNDGGMTFAQAEQKGITGIAHVAFVLVAGGLGERLGYSGIKLSLETNLCTNTSYLELYVKYILAMQHMARRQRSSDDTTDTEITIPLVIMTSGDTDPMTRTLLADNNNFGMAPDQIHIVCQDKVPALRDSNAGLALSSSSRWSVETKPHGHGDVHHLLYREGFIDRWEGEGRKHVVFLQDTNALVINSVLPTLGVSIGKGFHMNSICIPRLAGEAAGAITRLEHNTDPTKNLVINVEYNQLDPLLKSQGDRKGDVADPTTGYSPYPGNANNIILELGAYARTLRGEDQGVVVEFVNPKYKDETRTEFKKPTRLECMMQDIPKLFQKEMGRDALIGFTTFDRWFTFSPAKNSLESGIEDVKKGSTAPSTLSSAESDKYIQNQRKLQHAGVKLPITTTQEDLVTVGGIPITPGPRVVLLPAFGITQEEVVRKIQGGSITERSSLVLEGQGLTIHNLTLDGALSIRCCSECEVKVDGLVVNNEGYRLDEIAEGDGVDEAVRIRGYTMDKRAVMEIEISEPGKYFIGGDGIVKKIE
eukprot:CAMPEP_0198263396 /NCGR_PEP_ID=MMETSP1447-20131203/11721_1 /TAXON_ID=420782 /ORGANISM="Chaetoceros dichaeta, Strain CCMP1751" /LENGTH=782 /DNA_ID=CAMNT_0043951957 /DNA_START=101 /DNA_END=2449 /DNA_ORIENTATION=+